MLSDEEKKAIELLEQYLNFGNKEGVLYINLRTIYAIIEKQSKGIEELNEKNKKYTIHFTDKQYNDAIKLAQGVESGKWQDKIKAKVIEVKDRHVKDDFISATRAKLNTIIELESLLNKEE